MSEKLRETRTLQKRFAYLLFFILPLIFLGGCGTRLYDYTMPPLQSLAAPVFTTPTRTPTLLVNRFLTETAQPTYTNTPLTVSPIPSSTLDVFPTSQFYSLDEKTFEAGQATVIVNSRLDQQILVRLQGSAEKSFILPQAGQVTLNLPAGTYEFWLVIPGQESRRGEKSFPSGYSEWVFSRSEDILSTPTPRWDTHTPGPG